MFFSKSVGCFRLDAGDLKFLNEYKKVMTPIAASLDVLQGEEKLIWEYCYQQLPVF